MRMSKALSIVAIAMFIMSMHSVQSASAAAPSRSGLSLVATQRLVAAISVSTHFDAVWAQADQPVADGTVVGSWMWGPKPLGATYERYSESPGGQRMVQFYDKSRMEINHPDSDPNSPWYITNGRLVWEMMTGLKQIGDNEFEERFPAAVNVAGDLDRSGLHFSALAGFATLYGTENCAVRNTNLIDTFIINYQEVQKPDVVDAYNVTNGIYVEEACHNVANVFHEWMTDPVSRVGNNPTNNWIYPVGLPLTEPYWTHTWVGGKNQPVLVQAFERRVLTYTPGNSDAWRVENGNVGRQYLYWLAQPYNGAPEWSYDGMKLAWQSRVVNLDIMVWDRDDKTVTQLTDSPFHEVSPVWQGSDTLTYVSSEGGPYLHNLTTGEVVSTPLTRMTTASNGKVAYLAYNGVWSIHVTDGKDDLVVADNLQNVSELKW
jgi:hypothetical protein